MASNIELLNKLGSLEQKQVIGLRELDLNTEYKIVKMEKIKTKFGKSVLVECEEFKVFLPPRFTKHMKDKMKLVVVESPAKARTISRYLGSEYEVIASVGHIRDLPDKELGVDIENDFKPKYVTTNRKILSELG